MEKLQAALARAREKRENDGRPVRRADPLPRTNGRRGPSEKDVADLWDAIPMLEASEENLKKARVFANKATQEAQHGEFFLCMIVYFYIGFSEQAGHSSVNRL